MYCPNIINFCKIVWVQKNRMVFKVRESLSINEDVGWIGSSILCDNLQDTDTMREQIPAHPFSNRKRKCNLLITSISQRLLD